MMIPLPIRTSVLTLQAQGRSLPATGLPGNGGPGNGRPGNGLPVYSLPVYSLDTVWEPRPGGSGGSTSRGYHGGAGTTQHGEGNS